MRGLLKVERGTIVHFTKWTAAIITFAAVAWLLWISFLA
jgi:hypothetical protein